MMGHYSSSSPRQSSVNDRAQELQMIADFCREVGATRCPPGHARGATLDSVEARPSFEQAERQAAHLTLLNPLERKD